MTELKEGYVYFVDGGYFTARYDAVLACWVLWTFAGLAGRVIGRTGFEVNEDGQLHHRIFDISAEEFILIASSLYITDLEEVSLQELQQIDIAKVIPARKESAATKKSKGERLDEEDVF